MFSIPSYSRGVTANVEILVGFEKNGFFVSNMLKPDPGKTYLWDEK